MKTIQLLIYILLFATNSFGQKLNNERKVEFFNQSFYEYFNSRDSAKNDIYILEDSIPNGIRIDYDEFKIHLIDYDKAYPLIRKEIITELFWARYKQISIDTVDIVIGGWSVDFKRKCKFKKVDGKVFFFENKYNFEAWCGGTLGYIPQGRLVYQQETKKWNYISEETIIKNRMNKK